MKIKIAQLEDVLRETFRKRALKQEAEANSTRRKKRRLMSQEHTSRAK
jgi:hypothetical protein